MNQTNDKKSQSQSWPIKALAAAVIVGMSGTLVQAADRKPIGDLEIYKAAEKGKTTITMMLDTSGSMSYIGNNDNACDLPPGISNPSKLESENSTTTPVYAREYCKVKGQGPKKYYYRYSRYREQWYECGNNSQGSDNYGYLECNDSISRPSIVDYESFGDYFSIYS